MFLLAEEFTIPERGSGGHRLDALLQLQADCRRERDALARVGKQRGMTADEEAKFDALTDRLAEVKPEIAYEEKLEDKLRAQPGRKPGSGPADAQPERGFLIGYSPSGEPVRAFRPTQRISPAIDAADREQALVDLGAMARGMITGAWPSGIEASQVGTSTAGGGILLAANRAGEIIDLARNETRVVQAGATTLPMLSREVVIAKLASEPTPTWRPEGKAMAEGELTFAAIMLKARMLGILVQAPVELIADAANLGAVFEESLSKGIALALDRVALLGSGAGEEPLGLENVVGVQTITGVGTPADYDDFSNAVQDVQEVNGMAGACILAPRTMGTIDRLKATDNQPLQAPESWRGLSKLPTNQIPTNLGGGGNESIAFVGDFSQMIIGIRQEITIEASHHIGFKEGLVWWRAYLRADIAVVRPNHFVMLSGITAS